MMGKKKKRLLVIIPDDLNKLAAKGEITKRYYNPDDYFEEVEIVSLSDKGPIDHDRVKTTVGSADLSLTAIRRPDAISTLGWNRYLLGNWISRALDQIKARPDLIRIHGLHLNGLLAVESKKRFNVPLVASVHEVGDWYKKLEIRACRDPLKKTLLYLYSLRTRQIADQTLRRCDEVICVYHSVCDYVRRLSYNNPRLIYNAVSEDVRPKESYELNSPPRLLNVGRQTPGIKEPTNILRALEGLDVKLDIIGGGPAHRQLVRIAGKAGVTDKVNFISFQPNEQIVQNMRHYDIYVYQYNNWEISKSVLEAMLCGLPIVLNQKENHPVREFLSADYLLAVPNSPADFRASIQKLLEAGNLREELGIKARNFARKNYDPKVMEKKVASIYGSLLGRH